MSWEIAWWAIESTIYCCGDSGRPARLAWTLCGRSIALACAGSALAFVGTPPTSDLDYGVLFFGIFLVFAGVGVLIALHRPDHPIGWLLLAQGLLWELSGLAAAYATYALFGDSRSLAGGRKQGGC